MSYPLRENLEVYTGPEGASIRCMKCLHVLCEAAKDWRQASKRRLLPPTQAGPLMIDLVGQFLLEQLYCPSCGALLNTDLVEQQSTEVGVRRETPLEDQD